MLNELKCPSTPPHERPTTRQRMSVATPTNKSANDKPTTVKTLGKRDFAASMTDSVGLPTCALCGKVFRSALNLQQHQRQPPPACHVEQKRRARIAHLLKAEKKPVVEKTPIAANKPALPMMTPSIFYASPRYIGFTSEHSDFSGDELNHLLPQTLTGSRCNDEGLEAIVTAALSTDTRQQNDEQLPPAAAAIQSIESPGEPAQHAPAAAPTQIAEMMNVPTKPADTMSAPSEPARSTASTAAVPTRALSPEATTLGHAATSWQPGNEASLQLLREIEAIKCDIRAEYKRREAYDHESTKLLQTKMLQFASLGVAAWESRDKK